MLPPGTNADWFVFAWGDQNAFADSMVGGSLTWTRIIVPCGFDNINNGGVFHARGTVAGPGDFAATITYAVIPDVQAARGVAYTGVDPVTPFEDNHYHNTDGENGRCNAGANDNNTPLMELTSTRPDSIMLWAFVYRNENFVSISPSGWTFVEGSCNAGGGNATNNAIAERTEASPTTVSGSATIDDIQDWVSAGLVVNPVAAADLRLQTLLGVGK